MELYCNYHVTVAQCSINNNILGEGNPGAYSGGTLISKIEVEGGTYLVGGTYLKEGAYSNY